MVLYNAILYLHSANRYLLLAVLVTVLLSSIRKLSGKANFSQNDNTLSVITMISAHLQLLMGIFLYFTSPLVNFGPGLMKNSTYRYWTVEHISMMLIAIILITLGRVFSKRQARKTTGIGHIPSYIPHRTLVIYNGLALLIIIVSLVAMMRA